MHLPSLDQIRAASDELNQLYERLSASVEAPRRKAPENGAAACRNILEVQAILDLLRPELGYELKLSVRCHIWFVKLARTKASKRSLMT